MSCSIIQSDCLDLFRAQPESSVDLVLGSPPYMDARTYGIDAQRGCQEWVDWMLDVSQAAIRVSKGLVLWVVAGVQRDLCYWPGCEGLVWEWWKRGNQLWRPCIWWKVDEDEGGTGIPGSGGKQWLRNDWEYILAFKKEGWLPWADNTIMGHEPVYDRLGGEMSNRTVDGQRANDRVGEGVEERREDLGYDPWKTASRGGQNCGGRTVNGEKKRGKKVMSNRGTNGKRKDNTPMQLMDVTAGHDADGVTGRADGRPMPKIANPGNVLPMKADIGNLIGGIVKARVGGGHIGDHLAHFSEAPYPEKLCEFFIRSFCPPGGTVCDCFGGSFTTAKVAIEHGRNFLGCDLRQSQVDLGLRRVAQVTPLSLFS